ncbi:MAG: hypothetical protein U0793_01500 [Gemmataceae bacterium]
MRFTLTLGALAPLALAFFAPLADAQSFVPTDLDRYYRGGTYLPYDGMPYTQRYGYRVDGSAFFPGYDARNLIMMDYLDRLDRAEKFGYCPPRDPFLDPAANPSGWRYGSGFRLFGRRW